MIPSIEEVDGITRLGVVPVPHTNAAVYAVSGDGRRWVAKREEDMGCEALLAEALCWKLGRAIGAPMPEAAFDTLERTWLSALVPDVAHWDARFADLVVNPAEVGAMFVLDLWMHNAARHGRNVLTQPVAAGARVWAIDGDEALVGHIDDYAERVGAAPSTHNHARGLPVSATLAGARHAIDLSLQISENDLAGTVQSACRIAREPRHERLLDLVLRQRRAMKDLLVGYLQAVESL